MPVRFSSIRGWQQGISNEVSWTVSTQEGISRYEVQKSTDGRSFSLLGTRQPVTAGISNGYTYTMEDKVPATGDNYYRVRSIDYNGSYNYSQVVKLNTGSNNHGITVYPNPVTNKQLTLQFSNMAAGVYGIRLLSANGQTVWTGKQEHMGGSASQTLLLGRIATGAYQLELIAPDKTRTVLTVDVVN